MLKVGLEDPRRKSSLEGPFLVEELPCAWDRRNNPLEAEPSLVSVPTLVVICSQVLLLSRSGLRLDRRSRLVGGLWPVGSDSHLLLDHRRRSHCHSPLCLLVVSSLCNPLECLPLVHRLQLCLDALDVKIQVHV